MTEPIDLREFIGGFVVEAQEVVATANTSLLEIEAANRDGTSRPRAVRDLFRALHTMKGLAGMIGVESIVVIAHALETLVRTADRAGGAFGREAVEVALQAVAAISERIRSVAEDRVVADAPERLIEAIAATDACTDVAISQTAIPPEWEARLSPSERQQLAIALQMKVPVWTVSFIPSEANATRGITITAVRAQLGAIGEVVKVLPRSITATADVRAGVAFDMLIVTTAPRAAIAEIVSTDPEGVIRVLPPASTHADERVPAALDDHVSPVGRAFVRVELSRLDELQDQLSLLIVSRLRLDREIVALAEAGTNVRRLREVAQLQGRQLRDLRRAILRARMVRVSELLEPLILLVRSLARTGERVVELVLDARDTELDKAVADRVLPALIHLVRNAMDHAIETPDQRAAIGKPRAGTIRVSCVEVAGNHIELVVADDGCGIDRALIAGRARRAIADDTELLEVLTTSGFSTREAATMTSGRGIGMDIVRRIAVGDLGGELSMTTQPGVGTSFTLRVPVTIAVMDVFSFQCGSQVFVVPAVAIEEIFEVLPEMLETPPASEISSRSHVERRGQPIPVVSLGAILAIDSGARARKALVFRGTSHPIAFTVDRMIGRQEVVVRPIDDPLVDVPGIAGATDLGDGRPTLVLDLHALGTMARDRRAS